MQRCMFRAKIHRATVTGADLHYEGSISIDTNFLEAADILPGEQVDVLNINTGARFTTYTIAAPKGSKTIAINGAAARLAQVGDLVIIIAYGWVDDAEARTLQPRVVLLGEDNCVINLNS